MNHIYNTESGILVSSTAADVIELMEGHSVVFSDNKGTWNTETHDFDPIPDSKILSIIEFTRLFTDSELENILELSLTHKKVRVFVAKLELMQSIDVRTEASIAAVNGLEQLGLIVAGRASEILA